MAVERVAFVQDGYRDSLEYRRVTQIADRLFEHLNSEQILELITTANQPNAASRGIQATFQPFATELGFRNEAKGLFQSYGSAIRPDYFLPLEGTGILLEVERGKTVRNNMDFLDFWKCHLCESAHYLFLVVPRSLKQNPAMRPVNEFAYVCKRLKPFFTPRNYTNVRGLVVFGY